MTKETPGYFEAALSDFVYDMASNGAICHLADAGYSINQIIKELDFPTPRKRVEKVVYQHMLDSGMILEHLPLEENDMKVQRFSKLSIRELGQMLQERLQENGEDQSYIGGPFGRLRKEMGTEANQTLSCLTEGEQDYLLGIPWETEVMYHRLNGRMLEIGKQLAVKTEWEIRFYFLKTKEVLIIIEAK